MTQGYSDHLRSEEPPPSPPPTSPATTPSGRSSISRSTTETGVAGPLAEPPFVASGTCIVQPSPAAPAAVTASLRTSDARNSEHETSTCQPQRTPTPVQREGTRGLSSEPTCEGSSAGGGSRCGESDCVQDEGGIDGTDYAALAAGDSRYVLAWLESIGLGCYADAFQHCAIDGKTLATLSESELG